MANIGVLGGMGPAATVDFMGKLLACTPATCDQEHLPVIVANLTQVPDRSAAILGQGPDPLPALLRGIDLLNRADVGVIVIPCNTSHHWYHQMSQASAAPIVHIAEVCLQQIPDHASSLLLATPGTLRSGFYQRALEARGLRWQVPLERDEQRAIDECVRLVKAGAALAGSHHLGWVLEAARRRGVDVALLACTELPIAASHLGEHGLHAIDSTMELARAVVRHAIARGWQHPCA